MRAVNRCTLWGLAATAAVGIGQAVLCGSAACQPDPRIAMVMRSQEAYFQRMSSMSFEATSDFEPSEWLKENFVRKTGEPVSVLEDNPRHSIRFAWEDGKFLYELRQPPQEDGTPGKVSCAEAFDGSTHFEQYSDLFATSQGLPPERRYCGEHPLAALFGFVVHSDEHIVVSDLYQSQTWRAATDRAAAIRETTFVGAPGLEVDFLDAVGGHLASRVFFASGADYLPVRVQSFFANGDRRGEYVVAQWKMLDTALGRLYFPTRIDCRGWVTSGNLGSTERFLVDSESLLVNEDIPDETFVLPLPDTYGSIDTEDGAVIPVDARLAKDESFADDLLRQLASNEGEINEHLSLGIYEQLNEAVSEAITAAIGDLTEIKQEGYAAPVGGVVQVVWSMHGTQGQLKVRLEFDSWGIVADIRIQVGTEWVVPSTFAAEQPALPGHPPAAGG